MFELKVNASVTAKANGVFNLRMVSSPMLTDVVCFDCVKHSWDAVFANHAGVWVEPKRTTDLPEK